MFKKRIDKSNIVQDLHARAQLLFGFVNHDDNYGMTLVNTGGVEKEVILGYVQVKMKGSVKAIYGFSFGATHSWVVIEQRVACVGMSSWCWVQWW